MNMVDTKKCFRGILFWREDVLKCANVVRKPLSEFVRELLHSEMNKHRLSADDQETLRKQIANAYEARKNRVRGRLPRKRILTEDVLAIPNKVIRGAKFIKEQGK